MKKLTVLMPFFNPATSTSEVLWRRCIESILRQTFADFTLLMVDDASTDNSADILQGYRDKRVHLVRNSENLGLTLSLNRGLEMIDTELVARHDSDDFSEPNRFEVQVRYMDVKPHGVVGSHANVWNMQLEKYDEQIKPEKPKAIKEAMRKENPMLHGSTMIRYDLFRQYGFYDRKCRVCQDWELWLRFNSHGVSFRNLPYFLYNRVSHPNCVSKLNRDIRKKTIQRIRNKYK